MMSDEIWWSCNKFSHCDALFDHGTARRSRLDDSKISKIGQNQLAIMDEAIDVIVPIGRAQRLLSAFVILVIAPLFAFNNISQFLILLEPSHHCQIPITNQSQYVIKDQCHLSSNGSQSGTIGCIFGTVYDYSLVYETVVSKVSPPFLYLRIN